MQFSLTYGREMVTNHLCHNDTKGWEKVWNYFHTFFKKALKFFGGRGWLRLIFMQPEFDDGVGDLD